MLGGFGSVCELLGRCILRRARTWLQLYVLSTAGVLSSSVFFEQAIGVPVEFLIAVNADIYVETSLRWNSQLQQGSCDSANYKKGRSTMGLKFS